MAGTMTPRERILAVLNREHVDRLPVDLWYAPEVEKLLRQYCDVTCDIAMFRTLNLDKIVWVFMDYRMDDGGCARAQSGAGTETKDGRTMWSAPLKDVEAGEANYAKFGSAPLADYNTEESLAEYPWWPDVKRFDYDSAVAKAREAAAEFAVIGPWVSVFEIYCQMRGLERSLVDLVENPDLVNAILDRIESIQTEMMRRFFAHAAHVLDRVFISDDIAGQNSLLMSPVMRKRYLQPRLKRWCDLIHSHSLRAFCHTDVAARRLIGPILDCGVDVLNPIQHAART